MRRFDLLASAQGDIVQLIEYAESYGDQAADAITDALFDCFERIAAFPHSGRARPDLADGLRSVPVRVLTVNVFYYVRGQGGDRVCIVRVLRQERDTDAEDFA